MHDTKCSEMDECQFFSDTYHCEPSAVCPVIANTQNPDTKFKGRDKMTVVCNPGFAIDDPGKNMLECGMDGEWNQTVRCLPAVPISYDTSSLEDTVWIWSTEHHKLVDGDTGSCVSVNATTTVKLGRKRVSIVTIVGEDLNCHPTYGQLKVSTYFQSELKACSKFWSPNNVNADCKYKCETAMWFVIQVYQNTQALQNVSICEVFMQ